MKMESMATGGGRVVCLMVPMIFLTACAIVAPPYPPDVDNIQALKDVPAAQVGLGTFESQPGASNPYPVPLRANMLRSPVGDSFGAYLADAMKQELMLAGRLSPQNGVEIRVTLLENTVDVGVANGEARLSARFVVTRDGGARYDDIKSVQTQWPSSFAAYVAVPKAREEYPHAVQKLLGELYADPAFQRAIQ